MMDLAPMFRLLGVFPALFAGVLLSASAVSGPPTWTQPAVKIRAGDNGTVVYDWSRERCQEWDVPDAPLRAFRNAQGDVIAFVSDDNSRLFSGPSLLEIRHTCHSSFPSHENSDPSAYSGLGYVTALWTADGKTVAALIHNEYHAQHFPNACLYTDGIKCWYTTILGAHSADGGQTFTTRHPPTVVAAVPFRQDFEQGRHRGFFNPSNILFHNGFFYMAANTTGGAGQKAGLCLFRTQMVDDPASWRGYDGQGYNSRAIDPYRSDTSRYVPCQPVVGPGMAGSITWNQPSSLFLVVYQMVDSSYPDGQTSYAWSQDLINWTSPQMLYDQPNMSSLNCADRYRYAYPSVLDPDAPGRNFDKINNHPYLFLTRFHVSNCKLSSNRDLVRMQLEIMRP
jgi:hypothetical protein